MLPSRFAAIGRSRTGFGREAHGRRLSLVALLTALIVCTTLSGVLSRPASADQVASLRARAATISQRLVEEQLQVDAEQQQVSVASAQVAADRQAMARIDGQVAADRRVIARDTATVRQQAVQAYMDSGADLTRSDSAIFTGDAVSAQAGNEYASIVSDNLQNALDQLHQAERSLQGRQAALAQRQAADQASQALQASALQQATATEQQMQTVQAQVTGALAAAVAAQTAAQDAAAAAAVARAQRAATHGSAAPSTVAVAGPVAPTTTTPTTAAGGVGQGANLPDPPLNPFLQCVVQAESGGNYQAVSPNGLYMGAFQFSQPTWNTAAQAAGLPYLVGVPPNEATKAEQDTVAVALYALDGEQPWLGDRCTS